MSTAEFKKKWRRLQQRRMQDEVDLIDDYIDTLVGFPWVEGAFEELQRIVHEESWMMEREIGTTGSGHNKGVAAIGDTGNIDCLATRFTNSLSCLLKEYYDVYHHGKMASKEFARLMYIPAKERPSPQCNDSKRQRLEDDVRSRTSDD